jgi:hypothetical protein
MCALCSVVASGIRRPAHGHARAAFETRDIHDIDEATLPVRKFADAMTDFARQG